MKLLFDVYSLRARIWPATIVVMPLALSGLAWFGSDSTTWRGLLGVFVFGGLVALADQIGRERGRRKQAELFRAWGGKPTTRLLRHRDKTLNPLTKARYHQRLKEIMPLSSMPTAEEERADPAHADQVYETCGDYLLEKTRDEQKFALLFSENINYGFRRNLWALKPAGMVFSGLGFVASTIRLLAMYRAGTALAPIPIGAAALNALLLCLWLAVINSRWVQTVAVAYALRLLAACEELPSQGEPARGAGGGV